MRAILTPLALLTFASGCALQPAPAATSPAQAASDAVPKAGSELARFPTGSEFAECMLDPQLPHPDEEDEEHSCGADDDDYDEDVDGGYLDIDPLEPAELTARQRKLQPRCKKGDGKACYELLYDAGRAISRDLTHEETPEDADYEAVEKALARACRVAPRMVCEKTGALINDVPTESEHFYERQEAMLDAELLVGDRCRTASVLSCKAVAQAYFLADGTGLPLALGEACDKGYADTCYKAEDRLQEASDDAGDVAEAEKLRKLAIKAGHRGVGLNEQACRKGWAPGCTELIHGIHAGRAGEPDPVRVLNVLGPLCDAGRHDANCEIWANLYSYEDDALLKPVDAADLLHSACQKRRHISSCVRRLKLLDRAQMPLRSHEARHNLYAAGRAGCMVGHIGHRDLHHRLRGGSAAA